VFSRRNISARQWHIIEALPQILNYTFVLGLSLQGMEILQNIRFVDIIEILGTFAFAISGIRLASAKQFDLFGAFVVGFVTAIGGGTVRDIFLDVTPFWMLNTVYLWCSLAALIFVMIFRKHLVSLNNTFFLFDSIGLGLSLWLESKKPFLWISNPGWQ
jgi:hypothetical protein